MQTFVNIYDPFTNAIANWFPLHPHTLQKTPEVKQFDLKFI